jgi:hypothetical protein
MTEDQLAGFVPWQVAKERRLARNKEVALTI